VAGGAAEVLPVSRNSLASLLLINFQFRFNLVVGSLLSPGPM